MYAWWKGIEETGKYRRKAGGQCQYSGVLMETTVSLWGNVGEASVAYFQDRFVPGADAMETEKGVENMIKWMGGKIRWGGMESNEMCRAMVHLHNIWQNNAKENGK
jgi:hypothetical protein